MADMTYSPKSLQMDATSNCQLACPVCPTADNRTRPVLGRGHLQLANFIALLDNNPELRHVELSNYGEMFLNPQLAQIIEAAYRRGVIVSGNNGVNLNFAREDALEAVVRYRVRSLTCSIDGATPEIYARYRRNGNLDNVLRNIDQILEYKQREGTVFPLLYWQFVVFGHNEHELELAKSMARERGMEFAPRLSWDAEISPVQNTELVSIQTGLGAATREAFKETKGMDYTRSICLQLWHAPVANWDGKLLGCCVNYWGDFGSNVFDDGLAKSAQSARMQAARKMLTGLQDAEEGVPCTTCDQYHSLKASGRWITATEIEAGDQQLRVVSLTPRAAPGMRFANIEVFSMDETTDAAADSPPSLRRSGRLFRFGIDQAMVVQCSRPGSCRVEAEALTPQGWERLSFSLEVPESPLCCEFTLDFAAAHSIPDSRCFTWTRIPSVTLIQPVRKMRL